MQGRQSIGIGMLAVGATLLLSALDKLGETWALIIVGVLAGLAVLDELAARRALIALAWLVATGAGVLAYNAGGHWWGLGATVVGVLVISPIANRQVV